MRNSTGIDWEAFTKDVDDPQAIKDLALDLSDYFKEPAEAAAKAQGTKMFPSDGNLTGAIPIINVFSNTAEVDFGYERVFDFVDMRGSTSKTFEILDTTNGITFEQVKEGDVIKLRKVSTAKAPVGYLKYGGGLGFLDDWFRFNQYYLMDDIVRDVRAKYYNTMAGVHYSLITGLTGIDQAFATDDVTTINNACAQILKDLEGKGYAPGENPSFKILCGVGLKARIAKALAAAFYLPNSNNNQIVYNIDEVIASSKIPDANYWVCVPGIKSKRAVWDDLNSESQRDALRRAEDITWEGKFNAAIADKLLFKKCALA